MCPATLWLQAEFSVAPLSSRRTSWSHRNYVLLVNEPGMQVNLVEAADTHGRHCVNRGRAMTELRVDVGAQGCVSFGHLPLCIYTLVSVY